MTKQTVSFESTFNLHITNKGSSRSLFFSFSELHKQIISYALELFSIREALQYVNDNLLRKEMKNGAAFKCDVKGRHSYLCARQAEERKRSVSALMMKCDVLGAGSCEKQNKNVLWKCVSLFFFNVTLPTGAPPFSCAVSPSQTQYFELYEN